MAKQAKQVPKKIKVVNAFNYENNERTCERCVGPSQTEPDTSYSIEELYQRALQGLDTHAPIDLDYDDHFDSPDLHSLNALDIAERYEKLQEWEKRLKDKTETFWEAKKAEAELQDETKNEGSPDDKNEE